MIPISINEYADYLSRQFWVDYGASTRNYNLTDTGYNPNLGVMYYNMTSSSFDLDGITPDRYWMVRESFKLLSATLGITFIETTSTGDEVDFFFTDNTTDSAYSYPSGISYSSGVDYTVINVSSNWYGGISTPDSYTPQTYLHEILHGLGLGHAGTYNYTGTPLTYQTSALFTNDSWSATVMSYWDQTQNPNTNNSFAWIKTPMISDWTALDYIYRPQGFSFDNAFVGDTTYGFNTNILDSVSAIWSNFSSYAPTSAYTIVDGQGYDTLDLSGYTQDQFVDLRPSDPNAIYPYYSNVAGLVGNLSIAPNTIIEKAIGGSANDTFIGNDADNSFVGGAGIDRVKYFKNISDFTVNQTTTGISVLDNAVGSTDTLASDIELLEFNDALMDHRRLWKDQTVFAEYGQVTLDHNWITVNLDNEFINPVVIVSDLTFNGGQPAAIRMTNVGANSFMMRIQEPLYLDGIHLKETVSYFVIESGTWDLGNDMVFSAGTTQTNKLSTQGFQNVSVPVSDIDNIIASRDNDYGYNEPLSVMTQIQSFNGGDWVVTRTDAVTGQSFNVTMQEEEARNMGLHLNETIGWVAFNQDSARVGDLLIEGGTTPTQFNHNASTYTFDNNFSSSPTLLTKLSTFNGSDTANTRVISSTATGFTAFVQEEQSRDLETNHLPEALSYLALSGTSGTLTGTKVNDIFDTQPNVLV